MAKLLSSSIGGIGGVDPRWRLQSRPVSFVHSGRLVSAGGLRCTSGVPGSACRPPALGLSALPVRSPAPAPALPQPCSSSSASARSGTPASTSSPSSSSSAAACARAAPGRGAARRPHVAAAAASAAAGGSGASEPQEGGLVGEMQRLASATASQASRFWSLSGRFMPMVGLFFLLAFVNTILDSLKDTLVITAAGGGAQVIPYLTVYAVLPSSLVFLVLYSYASQRFKRQALFNGIVGVFMAFFVAFAYLLYPNHMTLHPAAWADKWSACLPLGLDGAVGMIRNWTFTAFFCMSELWGDVCLGLLFWGLANDTTSLADAPTLYPLFGLGANVAQALAGFVLKYFSAPATHGGASFTWEIQALMSVVLVLSVGALAVHHGISRAHSAERQQRRQAARQERQERRAVRRAERAAQRAEHTVLATADALAYDASLSLSYTAADSPSGSGAASPASSADSTPRGSFDESAGPWAEVETGGAGALERAGALRSAEEGASSSGGSSSSGVGGLSLATVEEAPAAAPAEGKKKEKQSLAEIYRTLASSVPIRCLVVMSVAQGLCTNLMEFAWKSHIRLLYPTPAAFTSFLGDVSTWQGIVTGMLMVLSPAMFDRLGWAGVAAATPQILLYGGGAFFASAIAYQVSVASSAPAVLAPLSGAILQVLVYGGALLYVFSKSAKFSLFKPAEEMVYISLDEEGRTKGKAAIDVVGSQAGKSGGSVLQQALLLLCGGAIAGQLPIMVVCYLAMSRGWLKAVATLSKVNNYGHASSVHSSFSEGEASMDGSMLASLEEARLLSEEDEAALRAAAAAAASSGGSSSNGSGGNGSSGGGAGGSGGSGVGHGPVTSGNGARVGEYMSASAAHATANGSGNGSHAALNGHSSGAHVNGNGHANGHVNGHANGHVNGHANGYSNGNGNGGGAAVVRDAVSAAAS
ncbi:hypothetical protein HYH03_017948 [Edaphochlamys debaryana]|uniref:ADP,ATP carrier protein n=1 Tax=Edaphochlamys debaryana TaxID=47281 RepID=A0A835XIY7_9CHLO|nr:hypothetical protein HYH03_017948 [Edaphochlamys debaryana]|eukprot:KAG2483156.1 hypothetical protein HYH03_017948 [Edaphochlamys debaryana]